jgi:hypothetical protein
MCIKLVIKTEKNYLMLVYIYIKKGNINNLTLQKLQFFFCLFHFNFDWSIFYATYKRNWTSVSNYAMNIQIFHVTVLVLPLLSTITKATFISCCTLSFICELSYAVDYHFEVPEYTVLMVFTWELSAKNNSPALSLCGSVFLPCFGAKIFAQYCTIDLFTAPILFPLSFIYCCTSPYLPGERPAAYVFYEYITVTFCLAHQSRHWWECIGLSVFSLKTVRIISTVLTKIHGYFTLICHWLNGINIFWYNLIVPDYENSLRKFW